MGRGIPRIAQIQQAVALECGVDVATMRAPDGSAGSRCRQVAHPRQAAMALALLLTEHSYTRIGHFFGGRDPTTVRQAGKKVAKRRVNDPNLHGLMRRVTLELVCGAAL